MPDIEVESGSYLISSYWRHCEILEIDNSNEVVKIGVLDNRGNIVDILENVPVFFHCSPDSEKNEVGGIKDGILAFEVGDIVAVYFDINSNPKVISNLTKKRKCRRHLYLIFNNTAYKFSFSSDTVEFNSELPIENENNTFTIYGFEFPENYTINQHFGIIERIRVLEQGTVPWYNLYVPYTIWQFYRTTDDISKIENILKNEFYFCGLGPSNIASIIRKISNKIILVTKTEYIVYIKTDNKWELENFYIHNLIVSKFIFIDQDEFVYYRKENSIWRYHPQYGSELLFIDSSYHEEEPNALITYFDDGFQIKWFDYVISEVGCDIGASFCWLPLDVGPGYSSHKLSLYAINGEKPEFLHDYDSTHCETISSFDGNEFYKYSIHNRYLNQHLNQPLTLPGTSVLIPGFVEMGCHYHEVEHHGYNPLPGKDSKDVFTNSVVTRTIGDFIHIYLSSDYMIEWKEEHTYENTINIMCDYPIDRTVCCDNCMTYHNCHNDNCESCTRDSNETGTSQGDKIRRIAYISEDDLQAIWFIGNNSSMFFIRFKKEGQWLPWEDISYILEYLPFDFNFSEEDIWSLKFGLCYL